jgi:hypothetical protein
MESEKQDKQKNTISEKVKQALLDNSNAISNLEND